MSAEPVLDDEREEHVVLDRDHPWPGLASFDENAREFFRGRDRDVDELFRLVQSSLATVLYGMAGLGKTSLVQAGLFPRLREANALPVSVRLDFSEGSAPLVEQVFDAIARDVAAAGATLPLRRDRESLWEYFHRREVVFWTERHRVARPVMVFDQFEEIFTLGKDAANGREEFLIQLADLADGTPPQALVGHLLRHPADEALFDVTRHRYAIVLSLREDYIAELDAVKLKTRPPTKRLVRMSGRNAREVVDAGAHLVDPETADAIVRFVATGDPESQEFFDTLEVDPALLSVICAELNEKRDADGKIDRGLLERNREAILTGFYEDAMEPFGDNVRRFIEDGLLTPNGYRGSMTEDQASGQFGVDAVTIRRLVRRRLVRIEARGRARRVELTHDLLTGVIAASRDRRKDEEKLVAERARAEAEKREKKIRARLRLTNVALLIAVGALITAGVFWVRFKRAQTRAQQETARWSLRAARDHIRDHELDEALALLANAVRADPDDIDARRLTLNLLLTQIWYVPEKTWTFKDEVGIAAVSRDGRRALATTGNVVHLIDTAGGEPRDLTLEQNVAFAQFTNDGARLVTADDTRVKIWNAADGKLVEQWTEREAVDSVTISPDGSMIAIGAGPTTRVHRAGRPDFVQEIDNLSERGFAFSPDSKRFAIATQIYGEQTVKLTVYDAATQQAASTATFQAGTQLLGVFVGPSLDVVAIVEVSGVRVWQAANSVEPLFDLSRMAGIDFSPDGKFFLAVGNGRVAVMRLTNDAKFINDEPLDTITFGENVQEAGFAPDGLRIITISTRGDVRLWSALNVGSASASIAQNEAVHSTSLTARGEAVFLASENRVQLRRTPGLMQIAVPDALGSAAVGADEQKLYVQHQNGIEVLGATNGMRAAEGTIPGTLFAVPNKEQRIVVVRGEDLFVHDMGTGREFPLPYPHQRPGGRDHVLLRVSEDGRRALLVRVLSTPFEAAVYDLSTGAMLKQIRAIAGLGLSRDAAISDDGKRIAFVSAKLLAVFDVASDHVAMKQQHYDTVAFDAPGTHLLVADEKNVHILDATSLQESGDPYVQPTDVSSAFFSRDAAAASFAAILSDGTAMLWQRNPAKLIASQRPTAAFASAFGEFSPNSDRLLLSSQGLSVVMWDARNGVPVTLQTGGAGFGVRQFHGEGRRIVTAEMQMPRVTELVEGTPDEAGLLADFAEHVAGLRFEDGTLIAVDDSGFAVPRDVPAGDVRKIIDCFAARDRTLTPFTTTRLRDYIAQRATSLDARRQLALVYPGK